MVFDSNWVHLINKFQNSMSTRITRVPSKRKPRVDRYLKSIGPRLIENTKKVLLLRGNHTNQLILDCLHDIALLEKPNIVTLQKKNEIFPFEDTNSLEFLTSKNDCSLFAFGSHSKKRPNNLVLGRTFDGHVLDMVEFGVDRHESMASISGPKKTLTSKPMIVFLGEQWNVDLSYGKIQSFLIDFFRGDKTDRISLKGLDHVVVCTAIDGKVLINTYIVSFKKSGTRVPNVQLMPMGPNFDLVLRRTKFASDDLMTLACKQPLILKKVKVKNITETNLGEKKGQLHLQKQNFNEIQGRRMSALRTSKKRSKGESMEGSKEPGTDGVASKKLRKLR